MSSPTVNSPVAEASAAAIVPRAIYVTGYDPVVFPEAATASVGGGDPTLYAGGDFDHTPYRPPVSARRGWRVAVAPPIVVASPAVTASAAGVVPALSVSLGSVLVSAANAAAAGGTNTSGVSYQVEVGQATGSAATAAAPRVGEYRNPFVVDSIATVGAYTIDPVVSVSKQLDVAVTSASAASVNPVAVLAANPPPATASAAGVDAATSASALLDAAAATASSDAVAPVVKLLPEFGGSAGATATSVTLPTHKSGDVIIILAYRYATNNGNGSTPPTAPTASGSVPTWTTISTNSGTGSDGRDDFYNSQRIAYTVATSNSHTSGTWTNANQVVAFVISNAAASPIGGSALGNGTTSSSMTAPAVTMTKTDGTSVLIHTYMTRFDSSLTWSSAPSGYTRRFARAVTNAAAAVNTKNVTTSDGAATQSLTSTKVYPYLSATLEILAL